MNIFLMHDICYILRIILQWFCKQSVNKSQCNYFQWPTHYQLLKLWNTGWTLSSSLSWSVSKRKKIIVIKKIFIGAGHDERRERIEVARKKEVWAFLLGLLSPWPRPIVRWIYIIKNRWINKGYDGRFW